MSEFDTHEGIVEAGIQKQLVLQQLSQFEAGWQQAQANVYEAKQRAAALRTQAASTPQRQITQMTKIGNAQLLANLEATLLSLELKRAELRSKYASAYPPVIELETQITDARRAIAEAEESPLQQITTDRLPAQDWMATELARADIDWAALKAQADATGKVVEHYRGLAKSLDERAMQQADLVRNAKTSEDNYLLYMRKREEARISDALDSKRIVNVSIAEAASVPALPTAHLAWVLIGGFFIASIVSVGAAYGIDHLDTSFRTPYELNRVLDLKVLASIPTEEKGR